MHQARESEDVTLVLCYGLRIDGPVYSMVSHMIKAITVQNPLSK